MKQLEENKPRPKTAQDKHRNKHLSNLNYFLNENNFLTNKNSIKSKSTHSLKCTEPVTAVSHISTIAPESMAVNATTTNAEAYINKVWTMTGIEKDNILKVSKAKCKNEICIFFFVCHFT